MKISFEYDDLDEAKMLEIIGCSSDDLPSLMSHVAKAAFDEYISMFLGKRVFRRATDLLEYRLLLLIKEMFGGYIPDDAQVTRLFQTTLSESRSILRTIMSKYQYDLNSAIRSSIVQILENATIDTNDDTKHVVVVNSSNLINQMNSILAETNGSLPSIFRKRGGVSSYIIEEPSYDSLRVTFGLNKE